MLWLLHKTFYRLHASSIEGTSTAPDEMPQLRRFFAYYPPHLTAFRVMFDGGIKQLLTPLYQTGTLEPNQLLTLTLTLDDQVREKSHLWIRCGGHESEEVVAHIVLYHFDDVAHQIEKCAILQYGDSDSVPSFTDSEWCSIQYDPTKEQFRNKYLSCPNSRLFCEFELVKTHRMVEQVAAVEVLHRLNEYIQNSSDEGGLEARIRIVLLVNFDLNDSRPCNIEHRKWNLQGFLGENYSSPLNYAVHQNLVHVIPFLLEAGADACIRSAKGYTALHVAAVSVFDLEDWDPVDNAVDIMQMLLESGADVNALSDDGSTPLHSAISVYPFSLKADLNCRYERARFLIKSGARVDDETLAQVQTYSDDDPCKTLIQHQQVSRYCSIFAVISEGGWGYERRHRVIGEPGDKLADFFDDAAVASTSDAAPRAGN